MVAMARVSLEDVELGEMIDEGAHAKVYKARWKGKTVAVKEMEHTRKTQIMYKREVAIHRKLSHPNIVQFYGIYMDPKRLWIIMEYAELGSLAALTKKAQAETETSAFKFTDEVRLRIMRELADVLQYLHGLSPAVVHHDIKTANVLLDASGSVKLCDFGLSASGNSKASASTRGRGTPLWSPEEVLQNQANAHDRKVDIYGFALVAWNLWAICEPFAEYTDLRKFVDAMCRDHIRPTLPTEWPLSIRQLLAWCWNHDPDQRPAASLLAKHCLALTLESSCGAHEAMDGSSDGPAEEMEDGMFDGRLDGCAKDGPTEETEVSMDGRSDGSANGCSMDGRADGMHGVAMDGLVRLSSSDVDGWKDGSPRRPSDGMHDACDVRMCRRSGSLSDGLVLDGQGDVVMDGSSDGYH